MNKSKELSGLSRLGKTLEALEAIRSLAFCMAGVCVFVCVCIRGVGAGDRSGERQRKSGAYD